MFFAPKIGTASLLALTLLVTACGGGGGSTSTSTPPPNTAPTPNTPPTADAGADRDVAELVLVSLDGSGSGDADGNTLTYAWVQTAGPNVVLSDPNIAQPTFTAPDVAAGSPEVLSFQLTVNDGIDSDTDTVNFTVSEPQSEVTVAGRLFYEFVPPIVRGSQCDGLDIGNPPIEKPMRQVPVQLLDANDVVLDSTVSADDGSYSFTGVEVETDVRIRVRAELKSSGPATWDVEIRDNVVTPENSGPLNSRALYVTQWSLFNTGSTDIADANFTAKTGWSGAGYTSDRSAAPFAILDTIYTAMKTILAVHPTATFAPLDAFWNVNNTPVSPTDIDAGELASAFYDSGNDSLFLMGNADTETDEFDTHLVLHEWTHHFDDTFSRSDSIGGAHFLGESLDLRLAFGEGFAHALAAIAAEDPQYCDTGAVLSGAGSFGFNTETNNSGVQGWFNELSVATLVYDLWDTDVDGTDVDSIGFRPIYDTMTGPQRLTPAFTTVFSFAAELRSMLDQADRDFVDTQLNRENIDTDVVDIWGTGQTTIPHGALEGGRDLTPIYTEIPTDGSIANVCINNDYVVDDVVNKLSDWRYLRFTTPDAGAWRITVQANPIPLPEGTTDPTPGVRDRSDPDLYIWRDGRFVTSGRSGDADVEIMERSFDADTYVIEMQEWRHEDDEAASDFPDRVCFDISMVAL